MRPRRKVRGPEAGVVPAQSGNPSPHSLADSMTCSEQSSFSHHVLAVGRTRTRTTAHAPPHARGRTW
jgi:hypothetical protein